MVPAPIEPRVRVVAIMGATATGKSSAGIALARRFDGEIVSMDSRQVYRGLDIGTGKVSAEEQAAAPHHLIDILDAGETPSAGDHARRAARAVDAIVARGRLPVLVGGTGLYFRAYLEGLVEVEIPPARRKAIRERLERRDTAELHADLERRDPGRAARLSPNDRVRIVRALEIIEYTGRPVTEVYRQSGSGGEVDALKVVLTMPRPDLRARIAERTRAMFDQGWVDEVRGLLAAGVSADAPGMNSLGYGEIAGALVAGEDPDDVVERVITLTQQYAKRQETYFRGEADAVWLDVTRSDTPRRLEALVAEFTASE
jgi:tRNA dimethylallyltransferase